MENHPPPPFYTGPPLPPLMPMRMSPQLPARSKAVGGGSGAPENPAKRRPSSSLSARNDDEASPHPAQRPPPSTWREPQSRPKATARGPSSSSSSLAAEKKAARRAGTPASASTASAADHTADPMSTWAGGSTSDPATASRAPAASASTSTASPYVRRKRALAACQFCRLRKTKCDNVRPVCGSCRHHQARCVYTDGSEADGLQVGLDEAASRHREVLERLDDIRNLLARSSPSVGTAETVASAVAGAVGGSIAGGGGGGAASEMGGSSHMSSAAGNGMDHDSGGLGAMETEDGSDDQRSPSSTAYLQYTKCESILKWPILSDVMTEEDAAIDSFIFDAYVRGDGEDDTGPSPARPSASPAAGTPGSGRQYAKAKRPAFGPGVRDQAFVTLCQKFLALVNCRNPILDAHDLLSYAKSVAEDGLDWDAKSCIVLLACALASYSRAWTPPPFVQSAPSPNTARREAIVPAEIMSGSDDETAEAYYEAAQKRFGLLGSSLIDIQCFYYASLFERFAFRPLQAWMYLQQAATRLRLHHMQRRAEEKRRHMTGQDHPRRESKPSSIDYHLEQRAFWSIHKGEREFATELGITLASDLAGFKYPAAFPTPPEQLNRLIPSGDDDDDEDDGDISDVFSPGRNEFIWFFYLAEISLRRTFDQVLSIIYEKGEQNWVENIDLVCRQYYESEKQISDWQSHLPRTMRWDPASQPNNEMAYYLEGRFEEWNECILRPLVYYCLHHPPDSPPAPAVASLAQRDMTLCVNCIMRCASHGRHGGTWVVLRRTFRCTLIVLAAVVAGGPLQPPGNWRELTRISIATLGKWSAGVRDLQRMRRVLQRVFAAVCDSEDIRMPVEGQGGW